MEPVLVEVRSDVVEGVEELRVNGGGVGALLVAFDGEVPVAGDLARLIPPERVVLEPVRREQWADGAEVLGERRRVAIEVNEHEPAEELDRELVEAERAIFGEARESLALR